MQCTVGLTRNPVDEPCSIVESERFFVGLKVRQRKSQKLHTCHIFTCNHGSGSYNTLAIDESMNNKTMYSYTYICQRTNANYRRRVIQSQNVISGNNSYFTYHISVHNYFIQYVTQIL